MRALVRGLVVAFVAVAAAAAGAEAGAYQALLAQLKGGDTNVDFQALRYAYAETDQYQPYGNGGGAPEAFKALQAGDLDRALIEANKVLDTNYVSIDAHFVSFRAYAQRNVAQRARYEEAIFRGLVDSISRSGDGKSPDTAFVVISVDEEYAYLGIAGLRVTGQALLQSPKGPVDAMSVVDKDGHAQTVHFNIAKPFGALGRSLGHANE